MTKWAKLILTIVAVLITWSLLSFVDDDHYIDNAVLAIILTTFLLASWVIIVDTDSESWSARTSGILLTSIAVLWFYGGVAYRLWLEPSRPPKWQLDMLRALYVVGGPLFMFGLMRLSRRKARFPVHKLAFWRFFP